MISEKKAYEILGVNRNATEQEIQRAFRILILRHHPDKNKGYDDGKTREITEARNFLINKLNVEPQQFGSGDRNMNDEQKFRNNNNNNRNNEKTEILNFFEKNNYLGKKIPIRKPTQENEIEKAKDFFIKGKIGKSGKRLLRLGFNIEDIEEYFRYWRTLKNMHENEQSQTPNIEPEKLNEENKYRELSKRERLDKSKELFMNGKNGEAGKILRRGGFTPNRINDLLNKWRNELEPNRDKSTEENKPIKCPICGEMAKYKGTLIKRKEDFEKKTI